MFREKLKKCGLRACERHTFTRLERIPRRSFGGEIYSSKVEIEVVPQVMDVITPTFSSVGIQKRSSDPRDSRNLSMYPIARFNVAIVLAMVIAPGEYGWYMHVSLFAGEALGSGHARNLPH